MNTLLGERFAPITSSIGYLQLPLDESVDALSSWRRGLVGEVGVEQLKVGFPGALRSLEPLTGGIRPRELLVAFSDRWTAYFDCSLQGTDAVTTIGHLSRTVGRDGLVITTVPHTIGARGIKNGRPGSLQFELFGPLPTDFLNYVRSIAVSHDGSKWTFSAAGTVQPFEETDAYRSRRIRDRFTSEMLERYCQALGLRVFDPASYGPDCVLIRTPAEAPSGGYVLALDQVQEWLEIVPSMAENLPG